MNATSPPAPIDWRTALYIFLAVLALSIPQAALLPLLDRDEPRFAEASREMLQSGNYVVPTFNGAPRYAKPPLIYWCQAASFTVIGENAFSARLPSLLATAGTAALLVTWGMRLGSAQAGIAAALGYAFCFQTIQQGRVATADALLIFFMTLTAFTGWQILLPKNVAAVVRRRTHDEPASQSKSHPICFIILALGFAGGFLAKGPEALIPIAPLLWCARHESRAAIPKIIAAFIAGLALVLLWAIPAYIETNGDYWRQGMSEGVGERMFTGLQGHGATNFGAYLLSLPYYVLLFFISALPWSPLLLIHRKKLITAWRPDLTDTYLLFNAALIFVIFTFMVTKLPHYTLPAFPLIALLFARRWFALDLNPCTPVQLGWITGAAFALLALIGIPIAIANHATPSPVGELVKEAGDNLKPETQFALVDFQEPTAIWEMRRVARPYAKAIDSSHLASFLNGAGPRAVIVASPLWISLLAQDELGRNPPSLIFQARGFNAAKGKVIDLTLVVKP